MGCYVDADNRRLDVYHSFNKIKIVIIGDAIEIWTACPMLLTWVSPHHRTFFLTFENTCRCSFPQVYALPDVNCSFIVISNTLAHE